jgi:hypothetical protein
MIKRKETQNSLDDEFEITWNVGINHYLLNKRMKEMLKGLTFKAESKMTKYRIWIACLALFSKRTIL